MCGHFAGHSASAAHAVREEWPPLAGMGVERMEGPAADWHPWPALGVLVREGLGVGDPAVPRLLMGAWAPAAPPSLEGGDLAVPHPLMGAWAPAGPPSLEEGGLAVPRLLMGGWGRQRLANCPG